MSAIRVIGSLLFLLANLVLAADQDLRVAGILKSIETGWIAIIETVGGGQQPVRVGDSIGEIKVLDVSAEGVLLEFPDGQQLMQITGGSINPEGLPIGTNSGILAAEFRVGAIRAFERESRRVMGLEDLAHLADDVRIVAIDDVPVASLETGLTAMQRALLKGEPVRLTLGRGASVPVVYVQYADGME